VLDADVVALLESGAATFLGTVDADGNPAATHCMGIEVLDPAGEVRVMVNAQEPEVLADLADGGPVALGATDVSTLRSVQLKGRAVRVEPVTAEDRIRVDRYVAGFFGAVHDTDGTDVELLRRLLPRELVALVMTVESVFDQTPGPQAGASLARA
jgi:hypothetical protein